VALTLYIPTVSDGQALALQEKVSMPAVIGGPLGGFLVISILIFLFRRLLKARFDSDMNAGLEVRVPGRRGARPGVIATVRATMKYRFGGTATTEMTILG
jgi:hypothetical protein